MIYLFILFVFLGCERKMYKYHVVFRDGKEITFIGRDEGGWPNTRYFSTDKGDILVSNYQLIEEIDDKTNK
jgi:hypothetical protein